MSRSNSEISGELDPFADSYRIRFGAGMDYVHKVYERDESMKEATNPKSHHCHVHNSKNNIVGNNSQRFSGNLKPGIIGLPGNIQNSSIMGHSARRPSLVRIIPQKNGNRGKSSALEAEPGSPKVSCMGTVLSEKPKAPSQLSRKSAAKKTARSAAAGKKNTNKTPAKTEHKGPGCLFRVARMFCGSRKRGMDVADESIRLEKGSDFSVSARISNGKDVMAKGRRSLEREVDAKEIDVLEKERDTPVPVPVPGIGGIKRFASGRKVEWNFEEEDDNTDEVNGKKSFEKDADAKERNNLENEKDTPVPVLVLGLGGLKRFASGRKVDWNFETETDGAKENNKLEKDDDVKERNSLEKEDDTSVALVPVLGIGAMNRFSSGRKLDWNFEVEKEEVKESNNTLEKSVENKEMKNLEKETRTHLPVPVLGIGTMKRFPSGRKVDWSFDQVDTDTGCIATEDAKDKITLKKDDDDVKETEDAKEKKTLKMEDDAKERNNIEKERDAVSVPRIGVMKRLASGRKMDWNFKVEPEEVKEENDCLEKNVDAKEIRNTLKKETDTPVTLTAGPRGIGAMKKFASGRKLDWNFEVEA